MRRAAPLLACALAAACATAPRSAAAYEVRAWGELRAVLREGASEGRVDLAVAAGSDTVALGLLAGLAGEITADRGDVRVARVGPAGELALERPRPGAAATLLVFARVSEWSETALADGAPDLAALERALAGRIAPGATTPFRVEGRFRALSLHVLDRACPIASPGGPPPWRLDGAEAEGVLVGFYAEGAEGRITHHGSRTHVHAIVRARDGREVSGHVDAVAIEPGARLFLPSLAH